MRWPATVVYFLRPEIKSLDVHVMSHEPTGQGAVCEHCLVCIQSMP